MAASKPKQSSEGDDNCLKSDSSSSRHPSLINIILLYFTLVGLGAIGGYATFYAVFTTRCAEVLDETERLHNKTRGELEQRYLSAVDAHTKCTEDDSRGQEVEDLRGRLDSHETLVGEHRSLLKKYQQSVERLSALKNSHDEMQQKSQGIEEDVEEKRVEISRLHSEVEIHRQEKMAMEKKLADQRDLSSAIMKKKVEENKRLSNAKDECSSASRILDLEMEAMKEHIRNRQGAAVIQENGKGPFYFQFVLNFQGYSEPDSFIVELPSVKELPHSVYTFLELVENSLYERTSFLWNTDKVLRISGSENQDGILLAQRYKELGFGDSAMVFTETSPMYRCRRHSMGFVARGPALEIFLSDDAAADANRACFGRVVRGVKAVSRIEVAMAKGQVVDVVAVRHLQLNEASHNSEL